MTITVMDSNDPPSVIIYVCSVQIIIQVNSQSLKLMFSHRQFLHCALQDILADGSSNSHLQVLEELHETSEAKRIALFTVVDEDIGTEAYQFSLHDPTEKFQLNETSGLFEVRNKYFLNQFFEISCTKIST